VAIRAGAFAGKTAQPRAFKNKETRFIFSLSLSLSLSLMVTRAGREKQQSIIIPS